MNKQDFKEFAVAMFALAEEFGGKLSVENVKIRFSVLKEYSIEEYSQACRWLYKNRVDTFPPVPKTKEIIHAIGKVSGLIDPKIKANEQCDIVLQYFNCYGRDYTRTWKDPITHHLMTNRWSFHTLDQLGIKDPALQWFRKEFVEAYLDYKKEDVELIEGKPGTIPIENLKKLLPEGIKELPKPKPEEENNRLKKGE